MENEMLEKTIGLIVADDLAILRDHFCSIINGEKDMKVLAQASSGKQAVQLAAELKPDLMLMDIEMDMRHDGIFAAQEILAANPEIRIVFLTIHEDDDTVFNAFEVGAVDYILKTIDSSELVAGIRAAYRRNSPIRPEIASKIRNEFSRIRRNESRIFDAMSIVSSLTPSEKAIITLLLQGKKPTEITAIRNVELTTIKSQINVILKKFNKNRTKEIVKMIKDMNIAHLFYR